MANAANRVTAEQKRTLLKYVTYKNGNSQGPWICTKCSHEASGRPNRMVSHLLCLKNKDVKICTYMKDNPDEREELARRLGGNPQPEQIVIPMDETFSTGALLADNNDGAQEGQSSQPDSTQPSFPRGGMEMCLDGPIFTPPQVNFDHMIDQDVHPLQDGATVDPSRAVSSMEIGGQQQLQPGEEHDIVNNLGDAENTASRAVISDVCANQEHLSNAPDLGSAGREGGASPDVTMQNAVSQEKGSKKRKCAPGSGTSIITSPAETSDASMPVPRETCTPTSHGQERACVPNTNNGVVQGSNDVDFESNNTIHQGQSSLPDSAQVSSPQGGMGMGLGDQIPHPFQGNSDHVNDQDTHPLQDGAGFDASTPGNAFGVGMAREPGLADPPPPCPPDFPSDLWDFYLKIDKGSLLYYQKRSPFALYGRCTSFADETDRKDRFAILASACSEVRDYFTNAPDSHLTNLRFKLYSIYFRYQRKFRYRDFIPRLYGIERKIREDTEQEVPMLATKRKREMNCWLTYAACFKTEVDNLDIDAMKAKSPTDILQLLERVEDLGKGVRKLIETGESLLNPVPKDLLSWNSSFMSCGSQLQNQMLLGQSPQPV